MYTTKRSTKTGTNRMDMDEFDMFELNSTVDDANGSDIRDIERVGT
jgi:hypothetical protein